MAPRPPNPFAGAFSADMAEVTALAKELRLIRSRIKPAMRKATAKSADAIKKDAVRRIKDQTRGIYTKHYPKSIGRDIIESTAARVIAVIGPDKGKTQGPLGNILEFGTSNNAPKPHLVPAWEAETDSYEKNMADGAEAAVLG